jgi:hypothetical protein
MMRRRRRSCTTVPIYTRACVLRCRDSHHQEMDRREAAEEARLAELERAASSAQAAAAAAARAREAAAARAAAREVAERVRHDAEEEALHALLSSGLAGYLYKQSPRSYDTFFKR